MDQGSEHGLGKSSARVTQAAIKMSNRTVISFEFLDPVPGSYACWQNSVACGYRTSSQFLEVPCSLAI